MTNGKRHTKGNVNVGRQDNCHSTESGIFFIIISLLTLSTAVTVFLIITKPVGQAIVYNYMVAKP